MFKIHHIKPEASQIDRIKANRKLLIVVGTGIALLLFAAYAQNLELFSTVHKHPARYGYLGDLLLGMGLLVVLAKVSMPVKAKIDDGVFASDDPNDQLEPSASQEQSIMYLADILQDGMPRSIALTGDWGSGKTAVYRGARAKVSKTNRDIIWVDFDPWRYASEEALVKGFYESIAKQLDDEIPGLQNALRDMIRSVDQLVSKKDETGLFHMLAGFLTDFTMGDKNPDAIIKGLLDREGKRLVIALDDIERQYDRERTYRALQLVHHAKTMGKDNVQVLCIYEKATLLSAAPEHMASKEEYLEKFSEIEINVTPPEEHALRSQLEDLLEDPRYSQYFPGDFDLKISAASIRDIKSHRGIIRAFNELLIEFKSTSGRAQKLEDDAESGVDVVTYVNYGDRFLLGHLKLKYPLIYRDIAENRSLYTQSKDSEEDLRAAFMDEKDLKQTQLDRFQKLFDEAGLNSDQKDTVKDLLVDLFPVLSEVLDQHKKYVDVPALRTKRRVGHRDVLDAYFALTTSQDAYLQHEKWINKLLSGAEDCDDQELISRFKRYMSRSRLDKSETDSITLLRNELLKPRHKKYQLRAFIAWFRVILMDDDSAGDDDNRALGRILSAINDIIQRSPPDQRELLSRSVFDNVVSYLTKPYTTLLMLLFLLPERQNEYLAEYVTNKAFKQGGLYQRVLKWVDNYFLNSEINVYKDYDYGDWAFITFQWALSIRAQGTLPNEKVKGAKSRHKRVMSYLYQTLIKDDEVAYDFILDRFMRHNGYGDDDSSEWKVNAETIAPHSTFTLKRLSQHLLKSRTLNAAQKEFVISFDAALDEFMNELYS